MSQNTKTKDQKPKTKNRFTWLLFALVIVFIYFYGLNIPLLGPDEPRYSQVAREMFERGDWITPTLGGFDWFEKPALLYWLQIASYKIFGVSEFAARFGSALFGMGTIFSLWILGKRIQDSGLETQGFSGIQNPKSKIQNPTVDFANWLALIAASSIGIIAFSRGASFDIILTFPLTAALVSFFIFDSAYINHDANESDEKSNVLPFIIYRSPFTIKYLPLFTFYFFIGAALLAKGLIGIVFPFAIVAFYYVLSWRLPNKTFIISLFWGTILSLIVASLWYLPMYQANGWKFVDEFFIQHHFQRYTSNKYQHPQPFWFFWLVLPLMTIPWLPFFLASIWNFVKVQGSKFKVQNLKTEVQDSKYEIQTHKNYGKLSTLHSPLSSFALAWLLVPLVFFSVSGSKLPGYILPALPAALIFTAEYVCRYVQKSRKREIFVKLTAFATFAVVAVLLQFFVMTYAKHETVKNLIETANANGCANERIVNLYTVSHNLEFYAAGRLVRDADGKLKRYEDFSVLVKELKSGNNKRILVLVPQKDVANLTTDETIEAKILGDNGESALVLLEKKF
ncbi:MAG: glycosyltransferase family 39 protein [Acidobacteriota bacterium]|nr:glycosyltransferase family 39 protein [Acidobacteriota bacterium]